MKCKTKHCRKKQAPKGFYCYSCLKAKYAKKHPIKYAFSNLRRNARRRGKSFSLTFEQFKEFAIKTDYINKRGTSADSYTIDRIDPSKGYEIENIQVLTNSENVKKYAYIDSYYSQHTGMSFNTTFFRTENKSKNEAPF